MKVLLIDDDKNMLDLANIYLRKEDNDFEIITETNPEKAFQKIKENSIDVVVSDYKMPKMNGLELLVKAKEENEDLPFIVMTGRGREEVAMKALNKGADHYIQKGGDVKCQFSILADEIKREIKNKRNKVELRKSMNRYRDFFETSKDCLFVSNVKGELIDCNHKTLEFFGFESIEEMKKRNIRDLYAKPYHRDILIERLQNTREIEDFPVVFRTNNGKIRSALMNAVRSGDINKDDTELRGIICPVNNFRCQPKTFRESFKEIYGVDVEEMDFFDNVLLQS